MSAHDRWLDPHDAQDGNTPACECCDAPDPVETITEPNGAVVHVCRECHDEYLAAKDAPKCIVCDARFDHGCNSPYCSLDCENDVEETR